MQIEQLGPYRIGRKLGRGGMGSVYEAVDEKTGQRAAVKALAPQLAMAEGFRERFEAEIESLKKLQHEGIVRLLGYGEDKGVLFYSMELVDGPSLEQELARGRRFDWNETLTLAVQICRALKHAHDHGIIHRDIKPANLLLAAGDRLKIADFGIARLFGSTQLTTAGGVLGTADYMSPEQADGRSVTERCDQYALGSVMYALLAGRPPFRAKTMPEMLQLQRFAEPEPVRRFAPQTPDDLDRLIRQLLSKDPAARFPNVLVLGRHMEAMQRALSRPSMPAAPAPEAGQAGADDQLDATMAFNTDVTLAPEDLSIVTLETDSNVFDAPTLADDVQSAREPAPATGGSQATATRPLPPAPTTRFTTVDEEAERQRRQQQAHHWSVALQLAGLAAALAAVMWVGWRLTRPPTADAVFAVIDEHVSDQGTDDLGPVSDEIADFLDRFPSDPRAAGVRSLADELELQKRERQLRFRARMSGDNQTHPIVEVFTKAARLQNSDPARAAAMLRDLLALYPVHGGAREALDEQMQTYLTLAERQLAKLQTAVDQQAAAQLPVLQERLATAARLEASAAAEAATIYRAVVDLYGDQPWAAPAVDEARQRLAALAPE